MVERAVTDAFTRYREDVAELSRSRSTTEESFYPAVRDLVSAMIRASGLRFQVRSGTSEARESGGVDRPDLAVYSPAGDFLIIPIEVKTHEIDLRDLAVSTGRNDQIGRYLASAGAVVISNIRSVGLVDLQPGAKRERGKAIPPEARRLRSQVDLWPSLASFKKKPSVDNQVGEAVRLLVRDAVTLFAPIGDPATLATILAQQAREAKTDLPVRFDAVAGLLQDYGLALGLSFDGEDGLEFFRSSLIQTAFYGLFAGWTVWHLRDDQTEFEWERLERYLEIPFLGKLFYEFRHPDRLEELHLATHLDRATETLRRVDRNAFFLRFFEADPGVAGDDRLQHVVGAAITYFYEPFLEAFDPDLRKQLGVWYTPPEIIRYQVERIDQLLRSELGVSRGLADESVVVLDPCCGTGAYLLEVVRHIARQLTFEGEDATLGAHLVEAVCRRVIGFEILTAPFVIAQLQLWVLLRALGAPAKRGQRPAVYLTNALTGWGGPEQIKLNFPELQAEHDAAENVKREARIIVILGNPPYNRFAGVPLEEEADLADHYKGITRDPVGRQIGQSALYARWGVRKHLLDDLYVRFFRLAERQIGEKAQFGIVSFISNSSYLTGRSHPLMRESLLTRFHRAWIDNMNGDKYKTGKVIPTGLPGEGTSDQSVFTTDVDTRGIQVGTAITTLLKRGGIDQKRPDGAEAYYREFWGKADAKRRALVESIDMNKRRDEWKRTAAATPEGPREYESIRPTESTRWLLSPRAVSGGYEDWPALDELFPASFQGVNPNRGLEGSIVDVDADTLHKRMRSYFGAQIFEEVQEQSPELAKARARYEPRKVWESLRKTSRFDAECVLPYLLFPLDLRFLYYEPQAKLINERRPEFWENLQDNEFLLAVPQPRRLSEARPMFCRTLADLHVHDRGTVCFPQRVRKIGTEATLFEDPAASQPCANLDGAVWRSLKKQWRLRGDLDASDAIETVDRLFRIALAVMNAPDYESEHCDSLSQDWARFPIPRAQNTFEFVAKIGATVARLLDAQSEPEEILKAVFPAAGRAFAVVATSDGRPITTDDLRITISYFGAASGRWVPRLYSAEEERTSESCNETGDLYINDRVYFQNVPAEVWQYELGGYPVLKKWLGYRQANRRDGRPLTLTEQRHFRSMVQRLAALLVLRPSLNQAYQAASRDPLTMTELGL